MDYDVLILGGGILGCSVAYEMSKYNLNIALIEKDYDIVKWYSHLWIHQSFMMVQRHQMN